MWGKKKKIPLHCHCSISRFKYPGNVKMLFIRSLLLVLLPVSALSEVFNTTSNQYGQIIGEIEISITVDKTEVLQVFENVDPQYQALRFCEKNIIERTQCDTVIDAVKQTYSSMNYIGSVQIQLGPGTEIELRIFDLLIPELYQTLFCANYFIDTPDCESLIAAAARIRSATNVIGIVPIILNSTWEVEFRVVDSVPLTNQAQVICDRYFLPVTSCETVSAAARSIYERAHVIGVIPLSLGAGPEVDLKIYDSASPELQVGALCVRQSIPPDSCNAVLSAAEKIFASASLVGVIPLSLDEESPANFAVFDSVRPETQAKMICARYDLVNQSCAAVILAARKLFSSANLVDMVRVHIGEKSVQLRLYDTQDFETQAFSFCTRHNLPQASCDMVLDKAMQVFAGTTVAGSLPIDLGGEALTFKVYSTGNVASQARSAHSSNNHNFPHQGTLTLYEKF